MAVLVWIAGLPGTGWRRSPLRRALARSERRGPGDRRPRGRLQAHHPCRRDDAGWLGGPPSRGGGHRLRRARSSSGPALRHRGQQADDRRARRHRGNGCGRYWRVPARRRRGRRRDHRRREPLLRGGRPRREDHSRELAVRAERRGRSRGVGRGPRTLAEPEGGGITWGTVVALIAAALFAGGFVGNMFASKRRPPARASVYDAVQRRLDDQAGSRPRADEPERPSGRLRGSSRTRWNGPSASDGRGLWDRLACWSTRRSSGRSSLTTSR